MLQASDYVKIQGSRWHRNISFEKACALILDRKMLVTLVPETEAFHLLGFDGIYELRGTRKYNSKVWHAIVIVGFGVRDGKNYFVIQNSHGKDWGDEGFGKVRDNTMHEFLELSL